MAKIGYARVSTRGQNDDSQVDDLTAYGCEKIFTDTASGKRAARPELDKALAYLRAGDVFVITRLSRAMRSLKHLLMLADELRERDPRREDHTTCTAVAPNVVFTSPHIRHQATLKPAPSAQVQSFNEPETRSSASCDTGHGQNVAQVRVHVAARRSPVRAQRGWPS